MAVWIGFRYKPAVSISSSTFVSSSDHHPQANIKEQNRRLTIPTNLTKSPSHISKSPQYYTKCSDSTRPRSTVTSSTTELLTSPSCRTSSSPLQPASRLCTWEKKQRESGQPVNHGLAKEMLAAAAGFEVDKLVETKGLDMIDREKAKHHAKQQAERMYDEQYGQYAEYNPEQQRPHRHMQY
ncbi:hypothetical protein OOU_Y34scaffold00745g38 [Pyricularia oryzae Y34]|uniref:CipC-like antibiotic response protein n=2 Tax=Pyricularia oryzae TaxID=318829 RepID=A0AA97PHJ4_PYRO3|nr:hypothetical protein OOU_Y34scaffold00745g38 [Pyricularia oryzae Y34]